MRFLETWESEDAESGSRSQIPARCEACPAARKRYVKVRALILLLIDGNPLPPRYKDHSLSGDWEHHRDCHIAPDWLLIYKIDGDDLYLVRTGSHADLF
jgi:mRNA interferase YafQ